MTCSKSFITWARLTFMDGVRCPEASVKSAATIRNDLMASAWETDWLARLMSSWTAALTTGLSVASASVVPAGSPWRCSQPGSASSSRVTSAPMKGRLSPTTSTWETRASARIWSSSSAGTTFLPLAVTMISFLRPVIVRKPCSSSWPMSPVRNQPSVERLGSQVLALVVAAHHADALGEDLAVVGDLHGVARESGRRRCRS